MTNQEKKDKKLADLIYQNPTHDFGDDLPSAKLVSELKELTDLQAKEIKSLPEEQNQRFDALEEIIIATVQIYELGLM